MKKQIKATLLVAVVAVAGFCGVKAYNASQVNTSMMSENIEALSQNDNGSYFCPNGCMGKGDGCYYNAWYPYYKEYDWSKHK